PATVAAPASIGVGAGIWLVVTSIISLFIGGLIAGRLSGSIRPMNGLLHGLATWGLVEIFSFTMMTTAVGAFIGGTVGLFGPGIVATPAGIVAPQAAMSAMSGVSFGVFVSLLLTGAAAAWGGWLGIQKRREITAGTAGEFKPQG
ncbi:MAG: hypothetical protein M0Z59_00905, partial [Nitrospiraceae bacterium]|nr:hypothetical protein [Nitrospiraceae bacterium]